MKKILLSLGLFCSPLCFADEYDTLKSGLQSDDKAVYIAALDSCFHEGQKLLSTLRQWFASDDPRLKACARTALGRITGQWASQIDLVWERSLDTAVIKATQDNKPIMVLQLFGKLDEEFC